MFAGRAVSGRLPPPIKRSRRRERKGYSIVNYSAGIRLLCNARDTRFRRLLTLNTFLRCRTESVSGSAYTPADANGPATEQFFRAAVLSLADHR